MKKIILSLVFATIAMSTMALNGTLFPALTDSVFTNTATLRLIVSGVTGNYQWRPYYKAVGDTFKIGSPTSTNMTSLWVSIGGLQPATQYDSVAVIVTDGGVSDTSNYISFTTKTLVPIQPMTITNISVAPSTTSTTISFHYSFVGGPTGAYNVLVEPFLQNYTFSISALLLRGIGDTSFVITNPNVPGTTYMHNILAASTTENGIPQDAFFDFQDYMVPTLTSADVINLQVIQLWQDSAKISAHIKPGNTGSAILRRKLLNAQGNQIAVVTSNISSDTIITWTEKNLMDSTSYYTRVVATSSGGSDSMQVAFTTLTVPKATVDVWSISNETLISADVNITVKTNGTWANSTTTAIVEWETANNAILADTLIGITGMQQIVFPLGNLRSAPAVNYAWIRLINGGGETLEPISFQVLAPTPAPTTSWGFLQQESPTKISLNSIGYSCYGNSINNKILVVKRKIQPSSTAWDTTVIATGLFSTGTLPQIPFTGLDAASRYEFKLIGVSSDGAMLENGLIKWEETASPGQPVIANISISSATTNGVVGTTVGNASGTPSQVYTELYQGGNLLSSTGTVAVGSDDFNQSFSFVNSLILNTQYEIRATVKDLQGSNAFALSKYLIITISGVEELDADDPRIEAPVYDLMGRMIGFGTKQYMAQNFTGQIVIWNHVTYAPRQ